MTPQDGLADNIQADADPRRPADPTEQDRIGEPSGDPEEASVQDWVQAENSRPTLPGETADGLDDMDEEVRREAEDLPPATPGDLE